jgi:pyruvate dehydrogenase E2 component (dihydrolipoamide acetyltransferase)
VAEEVKLPQLGESVTEGTITEWLVEEGESVEEDQPLFEISTDKIDTEVPSPASGVLKEIRAQVDDTVEVGTVVALIEGDGAAAVEEEAGTAQEQAAEEQAAEEPGPEAAMAERQAEEAAPETVREAVAEEEGIAEEPEPEPEPAAQGPRAEATTTPERRTAEDRTGPERVERGGDGRARGELLSPIVRRLVNEHDLDPSRIEGTGQGGRITREDVEEAIAAGRGREAAPAEERPARVAAAAKRPAAAPPARKPAEMEGRQRTEKLSRVRQAIARGMWESLQTTAQLTAAMEVDMTRVMQLRERVKDDFKRREGLSLSPLPFIARAVCMVLPRHEALNAAIDLEEKTATYYGFVNLGIAVDAEQGLIVPNVKGADDLTVPALAREISDLAERTRSRKLQPDEVKGGTFTITNTGSRGVLFDTPVLNPPEVGILATPKIEKRPVVVDDGLDSIAIRWMTYLCLTYDHRMVDGADAARFLSDLKDTLEHHDFSAEVGA